MGAKPVVPGRPPDGPAFLAPSRRLFAESGNVYAHLLRKGYTSAEMKAVGHLLISISDIEGKAARACSEASEAI